MKKVLRNMVFTVVMVVVFAATGTSDTIYFKNGTRLDIEKSWEEDGKIKYIMFGNEYEYKKDEIDRIERNGSVIIIENKTPQKKDKLKKSKKSVELNKIKEDLSLEYHKEALLLSEREEWVLAIEKERHAYELNSEEKTIQESLSYFHTMYAMQLYQKGQLADALKNCREALKVTPGYEPAKKGVSYVYVKYAQNAYDQRDFDSAEIHLKEASRFYKDNPKTYILYGKIAYDKDNYDEAKQEWLKALDIDPNLDEVKILLKKFSQEHRVEENFEEQKAGNFSVKFEGTEKTDKAELAIRILNEAYLEVGSELGEYPKHDIQVIIYPRNDIQELDYYPDMAAGLYDGKIRFTEDLFSDNNYLKAVLYHEYTHVIVHITGGRNVPIWINEGLAEYSARKFKPANHISRRKSLLKTAAKKNVIIPFKQLSITSLAGLKRLSYPLIALLYAQSESFVAYIIEKFTINDMRTILEYIGNGGNPQNAVIDTFNYSLEELEKEWKDSLLK
ncbi:MAG: tetratricopeptide repeat protein [Deltaproteobacteria bacterium]|nr:tetratricopeptide repeat protein [Deltaproteobacteria bacterium]